MILNALTLFTRATIYASVTAVKFTYSLLSTTLNICRGSSIHSNTIANPLGRSTSNTITNVGGISLLGTMLSTASLLINYFPYIFIFTGLPLTMSYKKIIVLLLVKSICGI